MIDDAKKVGREGLLTNMVLFDMNKQEAKELAQRNLLEYRAAPTDLKKDGKSSCTLMQDSELDKTTMDGTESPENKNDDITER